MNISVIIPAAGSGSRMNSATPKPFIKIGEETVLMRTLRCFSSQSSVCEIIIAISSDMLDEWGSSLKTDELGIPVKFVPGGTERMYSIKNALDVVDDSPDFVAVHDAVRPFVSEKLLGQLIDSVKTMGAVVPGLPVTDTVKIVNDDGLILSTPVRNSIRTVQTPQIFGKKLLKDAYNNAIANKFLGTDDASIAEHFGAKVFIIPGDPDNIKITYHSDIERANDIINKRPEFR